MQDFVSKWINVLSLTAWMSVVCGVLFYGFPWTGLVWLSLALSVALWMLNRTAMRSTAQVIWDVEGELVPVAAKPMPVVSQLPKSVL
jgi:type III secretory pathway component EscV